MILKTILKSIAGSFLKSIIGATLIVSGLIKANDTIGFSIKLSEYFEDEALAYRVHDIFGWDSFSLEWLMEYALFLAIFICVIEIVLGFCLIVGARIKETVFLLMSILIGFLILTLHTATCVPVDGVQVQCVDDCGCFGDALKFTPWGSFLKDLILIILLIFSSIITFELYKRKKYRIYKVTYLNSLFDDIPAIIFSFICSLIWCIIISWYFPLLMLATFFFVYFLIKKYYSSEILIVLGISLISLGFSYYTLNNLPIKDFRPYKIGVDVRDIDLFNMNEDCVDCQPELGINEEKACYPPTSDNKCVHPEACNYNPSYLNDPDYNSGIPLEWYCQFLKGHPNHNPKDPCIDANFNIADCKNVTEVREKLQEYSSLVLIVSNDFKKSKKTVYSEINILKGELSKVDIKNFYAFGGEAPDALDVDSILGGNQYLGVDETTAKTMIRSNPGIILIKKGIILQKWHYNNIPHVDEVVKLLKD